MQEPDVELDIGDVAPMLGQYQITIISQDKLIRQLKARVAELEAKQPLDMVADTDLVRVPSEDGRRLDAKRAK